MSELRTAETTPNLKKLTHYQSTEVTRKYPMLEIEEEEFTCELFKDPFEVDDYGRLLI